MAFGRPERGIVFLLGLILLVLCGPVAAQTFPQLTGRVVDGAALLDPSAQAALDRELAAFEARSGDQVVIVTVPDLQGHDIADYGYRLGRSWGIGGQGEDNGVILLVSRDDRRVRIEVGYGLEGTLTDALSRVVIENDILPRFRTGDYAGGIRAGTAAILQILGGDAAEVAARAERAEAWERDGSGDWLTLAVILFIVFMAIGPILAALAMRLLGRGSGGGSDTGLGLGARSGRRTRLPPVWASGSRGGRGGGTPRGGGFSGRGGSFGGGGASGGW